MERGDRDLINLSKWRMTSSFGSCNHLEDAKRDDEEYKSFPLCSDGVDEWFKTQAARDAYMKWANVEPGWEVSVTTLARMDAWMSVPS